MSACYGMANLGSWRTVLARAVVYFLKGRPRFGSGEQSAPFPSALAVWGADPVMLACFVFEKS